jgi:hypothetical protein
VKVLLAFILVVIAGSMWETSRDRPARALPLLALCVVVAAALFSVSRFV